MLLPRMKSSLFKQFQLTAKDNGKLIFCSNHYRLETPLNPKISFVFNAKIKTYFWIYLP